MLKSKDIVLKYYLGKSDSHTWRIQLYWSVYNFLLLYTSAPLHVD